MIWVILCKDKPNSFKKRMDAITGKWRCEWNEGDELEHVDLGPCDVISFPPGCSRRFMNVTEGEEDKDHLLLVVIAGNAPKAEFTDLAYERIKQFEASNN